MIQLDPTQSPVERWQSLLARKALVGTKQVLLVPWEPFADELTSWIYLQDRPTEFTIEHIRGTPSDGGVAYIGTIDGVHVYALHDLDHVVLCSGEALRAVTFHLLPDYDDIVDLSFAEAGVPAEGRFEIRAAQALEWSDAPIIEFLWYYKVNPQNSATFRIRLRAKTKKR